MEVVCLSHSKLVDNNLLQRKTPEMLNKCISCEMRILLLVMKTPPMQKFAFLSNRTKNQSSLLGKKARFSWQFGTVQVKLVGKV